MYKNLLTYRRTLSGTIAEILVPVLMIFMLSVLRASVLPVIIDDIDMYQLKKPYYPLTQYDNVTQNWTMSNIDNTQLGFDLTPFM
jgi:hypothetical protein